MVPYQSVADVSCVPYAWVAIVVSAEGATILALAAAIRAVYNRMNRLSDESMYRLEHELDVRRGGGGGQRRTW